MRYTVVIRQDVEAASPEEALSAYVGHVNTINILSARVADEFDHSTMVRTEAQIAVTAPVLAVAKRCTCLDSPGKDGLGRLHAACNGTGWVKA